MTTYCIMLNDKYVNFVGKIRHRDTKHPEISYTLFQAKQYRRATGGDIVPVQFGNGKTTVVNSWHNMPDDKKYDRLHDTKEFYNGYRIFRKNPKKFYSIKVSELTKYFNKHYAN